MRSSHRTEDDHLRVHHLQRGRAEGARPRALRPAGAASTHHRAHPEGAPLGRVRGGRTLPARRMGCDVAQPSGEQRSLFRTRVKSSGWTGRCKGPMFWGAKHQAIGGFCDLKLFCRAWFLLMVTCLGAVSTTNF